MRYIKTAISLLLILLMILPLFVFSTEAATREEVQYFLDVICPFASEDMKQTGILASLTIAQGILESGWGVSPMAKACNNLFGIKAFKTTWSGKIYCQKNQRIYSNFSEAEAILGKSLYSQYEDWFFRVYNNWGESLRDHSDFLLNGTRYANLIGVTDYKTAARLVEADGYCSDDGYSDYLIRLIEQYELYKYDVFDDIVNVDIGVDKLLLEVGSTIKVYPTNNSQSSVRVFYNYTSDNESVASVDSQGNITGVSEGAANITVKANGGLSDSCKVYVVKKGSTVKSGVTNGDVNCRTEPSSDKGSATVIGSFYAGTELVVFRSENNGWSYVCGVSSSGKLIIGYTATKYINIGAVFTGDTPVEVSEEPSEQSSEEPSEEPSHEDPPVPLVLSEYRIGYTTCRLNQREKPTSENSAIRCSFSPNTPLLIVGDFVNDRWVYCIGVSEKGKVSAGYCGATGERTYIKIENDFLDSSYSLKIKNDMLYGIPGSVTVSKMQSAMKFADVSVVSEKGEILNSNDLIVTGCKISFSWCGTEYISLPVVINGDVNCDGNVNITDYLLLRMNLLNVSEISENGKLASCVSGNIEPSIEDYILLRLHILGIIDINKNN